MIDDEFAPSDLSLARVYYGDAYRNRQSLRSGMDDGDMTDAERRKVHRDLEFLDLEIAATLRTGPWHGGDECPM